MASHLTTCTFCGVGCGIYIETADHQITGAYPSMSHPANEGRICVRGWHVHEVASSPDRLRTPLVRKNGTLVEASWDEAYRVIAERLSAIRKEHGPDSIGFLNSARCSNEESYLLQKMARTVFGTNNVDHGTGIHRSKTIEALRDMLGVPAATTSIADLAHSDVIIVDAIDLARQLPTVGGWVLRAKLAGAKLIVTGPRRHRIAESADFFLQSRAGTEAALFGAMAKILVDRGLTDLHFIKNRCRDYNAFLDEIQAFDLVWASSVCGIEPDLIEAAAITFGQARRATILYSTGAEARGEETIQSIVNLALLTGNIGREGAGILPLTEYNNLQGVCDVGMLPDYLPGYQPVEDPAALKRFETLWGVPLPSTPGLDARAMLETAGNGKLKALWLDRHDPILSATFVNAAETLGKLDFVVLQHLFMTETAEVADVILPVVSYGEEEVTFTSTERRIQIAAQVVEPSDNRKPAWKQIAEFVRHVEPDRAGSSWNYASSAAVMDEIGRAVPFYEGASYANLKREYGRQWPCTDDRPLGTRFLFDPEEDHTVFRFMPVRRPSLETGTSPEYPFGLSLGHSLFYWHRDVMVQHSETLKREYRILLLDYPEGFVDINTEDAAELKIRDGGKIRLVAEKGSAEVTARVTNEVRRGMIFVPFFLNTVIRQVLGDAVEDVRRRSLPLGVRVEKVA